MIKVELHSGESQEALIHRFNKKVKKSNILKEVWERRYYDKPSVKRNEKRRKRKRTLEKLKREREADNR